MNYILNQEKAKLLEMFKKAMAVPEPTGETAKKMRENGIYVLQDMISKLPNSTQKDTMDALSEVQKSGAAEFFGTLTPRTVVSLPQIYILNPKDVVEIDGKNYVNLYVEDGTDWKTPGIVGKSYTSPSGKVYSKGSKFDGEAVLLDLETGKLVPMPLPQIQNKIMAPTEDVDAVLNEANEEIAQYNKRISSITQAIGATKLVLQIARAKDQIDVRLSQLNGIIKGTQGKLEKVQPLSDIQKAWDTDLMNAVQNGTMSLKDAYDTVLYQYQSIPEQLISDIQSNAIKVPQEIAQGLLEIAKKEVQKKGGKAKLEEEKEKAKQERIKGEGIPEIYDEELQPFTREDIPSGKQRYKSIDKARTVHHEISSLNAAIEGSQKDIQRLTEIRQSMENMEKYMGSLEKGQRSKTFLNTPEGQPILDAMKNFLKKVLLFIETYDINTKIVQDKKINPKLFGPRGTKGNALLAAALTRLYNVVRETIDMYTGGGGGQPSSPVIEEIPPEKETIQQPTPTRVENVAKSEDKIIHMSERLWKAFEDRMRLK